MKNVSTKDTNYSLHNAENFCTELEDSVPEACQKIAELFLDYFKFMTENVHLKNKKLLRFILGRGLDTITNVFNHLLLYTKNAHVTYFHCQKAFYFYAEFVGQISEDEKQFLQLSSRDATTYVYKKTIFEVSANMKKTNETLSDATKAKLNSIHAHLQLYRLLLSKLIQDDDIANTETETLAKLYAKLHGLPDNVVDKLYHLSDKLMCLAADSDMLFDVLSTVARKAKKNPEIISNVTHKVLSEEFLDKLFPPDKFLPDKFIHWLTN
jgi:hypothetical protein